MRGYTATGEYNAEEGSKYCTATVPYREFLGALLWVSQGTHADITYALLQSAKFSCKQLNSYECAFKKILRSFKGTIDYGIHFK